MSEIIYNHQGTVQLTGSEDVITGYTANYAVVVNNGSEDVFLSKEKNIQGSKNTAKVRTVAPGKAGFIAGEQGRNYRFYALGRSSISIIEADTMPECLAVLCDYNSGSGSSGGNTAVSAPNLLINPEFTVNQRGGTSYSGGYTVDRWCVYNGKVEVGGGHITLEAQDASNVASLRQTIENSSRLAGKTVTFSVDWDILNAGSRCCLQLKYNNEWSQQVLFTETGRNINAVTVQLPAELTTPVEAAIMIHTPADAGVVGRAKLYSAKLETGTAATEHGAADPASELAKCQRYYQLRSTGDILPADLRPVMRTTPTVTKLSDNSYSYNAEI